MNHQQAIVRRRGRPQTEQREMDQKLEFLGGVQRVVMDLYIAGQSCKKISDRLFALTEIRIHQDTVLKWVRRWADEQTRETSAP